MRLGLWRRTESGRARRLTEELAQTTRALQQQGEAIRHLRQRQERLYQRTPKLVTEAQQQRANVERLLAQYTASSILARGTARDFGTGRGARREQIRSDL